MSRGERKRLLREATRQRIRAEREALRGVMKFGPATERTALELLKDVPTVFAFAEKLDDRYERPDWASRQFGNE